MELLAFSNRFQIACLHLIVWPVCSIPSVFLVSGRSGRNSPRREALVYAYTIPTRLYHGYAGTCHSGIIPGIAVYERLYTPELLMTRDTSVQGDTIAYYIPRI